MRSISSRFVCYSVQLLILSTLACQKAAPPPPPPPPPNPLIADTTPVEENFSVQSNPNRATVTFSTGETCTTPCSMKRMSTETFDVTIQKSGYRSETVTVISHAQVKPGSGATGKPILERPKLQPNPVRVSLEPQWKKR